MPDQKLAAEEALSRSLHARPSIAELAADNRKPLSATSRRRAWTDPSPASSGSPSRNHDCGPAEKNRGPLGKTMWRCTRAPGPPAPEQCPDEGDPILRYEADSLDSS